MICSLLHVMESAGIATATRTLSSFVGSSITGRDLSSPLLPLLPL